MRWTTGRLADLVGAVCDGDAGVEIAQVAPLDSAGPGDLAFAIDGAPALAKTRASAIFLSQGTPPRGVVALRTTRPRQAFARAIAGMFPEEWPVPGIHATAVIDPTAVIDGATVEALAVVGAGARVAPGAWVQSHAVIGARCAIGARARIYPHAVVLERCEVGEGAVVGPGAVVGFAGFGFEPTEDEPVRMPHLGTVRIGARVELGANTCVDRATLGATEVEQASKLDNLVHIAHNVRIGARSLIAAFSGVAGSARLGEAVILGGRASVVDGVEVGDRSVLSAMAAVTRSEPADVRVSGVPARPHRRWLRELAALAQLPELLKRVDRLEERLEARTGAETP